MIDLSRPLCAVGGHLAEPGATWNHGYAFSRCRRCGREIVRSLFGRWRLPPRGFRVVWRPAEPRAEERRHAPDPVRDNQTSIIDDFMDEAGPDFRWTVGERADAPLAAPEPYDFMRDEPRVQGCR
jgi:hypothetical protein